MSRRRILTLTFLGLSCLMGLFALHRLTSAKHRRETGIVPVTTTVDRFIWASRSTNSAPRHCPAGQLLGSLPRIGHRHFRAHSGFGRARQPAASGLCGIALATLDVAPASSSRLAASCRPRPRHSARPPVAAAAWRRRWPAARWSGGQKLPWFGLHNAASCRVPVRSAQDSFSKVVTCL